MTDVHRKKVQYDGLEWGKIVYGEMGMPGACTSALIAVKSGPLRDGLRALIATMPQIEAVEDVDDVGSALQDGYRTDCPTVVLLDASLIDGEMGMVLHQLRSKWPKARYVFLADDVYQHHSAAAAGADVVLLKGVSAARLVSTIARLLPTSERQ
jgi:DNA-binding NarL/FixJ family response regulator